MTTVLDRIKAYKLEEIAADKAAKPLEAVEAEAREADPTRGFADALRKMEIVLEDEEFERAFERFKELADRKGEITEEGIRAIIDYAASRDEELIHLVSMHVAGGNEVTPQASVKVETRGLTLEFEAEGDGMVHSL